MNMQVLEHYSLKCLNTFGVEASARYYCKLATLGGLRAVLDWQQKHPDLPVLWLGGGSNMLFRADYPGLVVQVNLKTSEVLGQDTHYHYVRGGAGNNWHDFVCWTLDQDFAGLENLSLIPGTVGAAPVQNIGAYGVELKDRVYEVQALDWRSGEIRDFSLEECGFAYRDSHFKSVEPERWLIASVVFRLPREPYWQTGYDGIAEQLAGKARNARSISEAVVKLRQRKLPDPVRLGNAGSFFKNPRVDAAIWQQLKVRYPQLPGWVQDDGLVKTSAGWLIDQCGWKGKRQGNVGTYDHHALVLVNHGGASGEQIWQFAQQIVASVQDAFGIILEPEPRVVG